MNIQKHIPRADVDVARLFLDRACKEEHRSALHFTMISWTGDRDCEKNIPYALYSITWM